MDQLTALQRAYDAYIEVSAEAGSPTDLRVHYHVRRLESFLKNETEKINIKDAAELRDSLQTIEECAEIKFSSPTINQIKVHMSMLMTRILGKALGEVQK